MFSKRVFEILYVKINVYGLDEYKTLPENTPLSAMFFCHGFGETQENLEFYCQRLCQLNTTRRSSDRYLIIITLDHPNSGTRKTYDESPMPKPGSRTHQDIIFKIHLSAKSTAQTIAGIIECFDYYAFGTECNSFVTKWGVIGYSMGGITAEFLPTFVPKIEAVIMISSCLRVDLWMPYFVKYLGLDTGYYFHKRIQEVVTESTKNAMSNLRDKHLLIISGDKERIFPKWLISDTLDELRQTQQGVEGYDWKCDILPDGKHEMDEGYIIEAMKWTDKWMLSAPKTKEEKMMANL